MLNAAQHYSLIASDHPAISHFYSFDLAPGSQTLAIPDGCVDILFDCDTCNPGARVCGTTLEARSANMSQRQRYFGVRFAPGVNPDFLDVMAEEIPDREFGFLEAVPDARCAFKRIVQTSDFSRQTSLFMAFFGARLVRKISPVTTRILRILRQQQGNVRVDRLEALTGYNLSHHSAPVSSGCWHASESLQPHSSLPVGAEQHSSPTASVIQRTGLRSGFSDQSHFLREFKKFVSATPQRRIADDAYLRRLRFH